MAETMEQYYERKWIETGDLNYLELANRLRKTKKDE